MKLECLTLLKSWKLMDQTIIQLRMIVWNAILNQSSNEFIELKKQSQKRFNTSLLPTVHWRKQKGQSTSSIKKFEGVFPLTKQAQKCVSRSPFNAKAPKLLACTTILGY